ncbi:MAG: ATP-binding protein [Pseudomonadota bacterium]
MSAFSDSNTRWTMLLKNARRPVTEADHQVALNQQRLIVQNSLSNALITGMSASLIVVYYGALISLYILLPWALVMLAFTATSFSLWRRFNDAPLPTRVSGNFVAKSESIAAVIGFSWSIIVFGINDVDDGAITFFVMLCAGKAAAFTSMSGQLPRMTLRFSLGCIVPVMVAVALTDHSKALFMFVLAIAFIAVLQRGAIGSFIQLQKVLNEQIKAQRAEADLSSALETINDAFAVYGADGSLERSNARFQEWFPNGWDVEASGHARERRLPNGRWVMQSVNARPSGGWVCVHTDISSLKARERELLTAQREAEDASAAKGRFLSTMSHELRTPLNIINGFSRLMVRDSKLTLTENTVREYGSSIHEAGEHLLTVINDIIEFSKSGADTYVYEPRRIAPKDLLASAVTLAVSGNRLSSLDGIQVSLSPAMGELIVDEMAIRRVLINLISNALKFGGQPMDVAVRAFIREDGCPVFSVRDRGPGLSPEEVEQVFAPFFQCDRHLGGDFAGTGLGLTLSRQLARLHDGDVTMRSREGEGTTVALVLPAKIHIAPEKCREYPPALDSRAA